VNHIVLFTFPNLLSTAHSGVSVKTRKRDVVAPVDPGTFADAVTAILQDTCEGVSIDADLEAIGKALDSTDLEYSKYGETLFEVLFVGGRLTTGGNIAEDKTIKATSGKPILHVCFIFYFYLSFISADL
jgi:hypothetical protein